jgi:hypothetical protein
MEDNPLGPEPLRELDGLERHFNGAVPNLGATGAELITVGRVAHDFDGLWTEIVKAGDLDAAGFDVPEHALHVMDVQTMAQFRMRESHIGDFAKDIVPCPMTAGVPTGGECKNGHGKD